MTVDAWPHRPWVDPEHPFPSFSYDHVQKQHLVCLGNYVPKMLIPTASQLSPSLSLFGVQ